MLVSQISYNYLSAEASSATNTAVQNALNALITYYADSSTYVTSACWMDDLKKRGIYQFSDWHFINLPICEDNNTLCESISSTDMLAGTDNIVWALNNAITTVTSKYAGGFERGFAFRNLMHLVGDLHQPLHCVQRFATETPLGDAGGNTFRIQNFETATNLHALWDAGVGLLDNSLTRPLSNGNQTYIESMANEIMAQLNTSEIIVGTNISVWALEGINVSIQYVYTLPYNSYPSDEYIQTAQPIVMHQLGVAGYRLAQLLKQIVLCNPTANNCPVFNSTIIPDTKIVFVPTGEDLLPYGAAAIVLAAALFVSLIIIAVLLYKRRASMLYYSKKQDKDVENAAG